MTARQTLRAALLCLVAAPAMAQDGFDWRPHLPELRACLAACDELDPDCDWGCGDVVHAACEASMDEAARDTTAGMAMCASASQAAWDVLLNEEWNGLMTRTREYDEGGQADALLAAQRAWIAWRDAECDWEYARWGGGTMRSIAHATCQESATISRTIDLRTYQREGY